MEIFGFEPEMWESIQVIVIAFMFIVILAMWIKLVRMNRKYKKMMSGSKDSLEQMLLQIQESYRQAAAANENYSGAVERLEKEMRKMKGNVEVIRYNAFSDQGSDMSFSIAFIDDEKDGLVLTGIHSRQESLLYAKPVRNGESAYTLTPEEKQVIDLATKRADK